MGKFLAYFVSFVAIPLYVTQGWIFESGSQFSRLFIFVWLAVDIFYFFQYFLHPQKSSIAKPLALFVFAMFLSWLLSDKTVSSSFGDTASTFGYLKNILVVILTYFPFRKWLRSGYFSDNLILLQFILLSASSIIAYFTKLGNFDLDAVRMINNTGYYFSALLPLLGVKLSKKYNMAFLVVLMYFTISSAKRGAILCFLVGFFLYFYFISKTNSNKSRYLNVLIMLIMLIGVSALAYNTYIENAYLQSRIENTITENDSSGRDVLYSRLLDVVSNADIFHFLFGYGMIKSISFIGLQAHQDWLELFVDNGLIGVILYLSVFISMLRFYFKNKQYLDGGYRYMFVAMISIWFLKSCFSFGYTTFFSFIYLVEFAIVEYKVNCNKQAIS